MLVRKYIAVTAFFLVLLIIALYWWLFFQRLNKPIVNITQKTSSNLTLVAAGDISCDHNEFFLGKSCNQKQTADLVERLNPDAVLALGDLQYVKGSLEDFKKYYQTTWGKFKEITYPVPGNHEYETPNAKGYFDYFGSRSGDQDKGYYSFDLGNWHLVALNSNCWAVGGCGQQSPQVSWLQNDLDMQKGQCILAYWHHPYYSSGKHGQFFEVVDFWKILVANKADIILNGHDHHYERFSRQGINGERDDYGLREFIVGTGGYSHYPIESVQKNSEIRIDDSFGVLKLTLNHDSYEWQFVTNEGGVVDSGSEKCLSKLKS